MVKSEVNDNLIYVTVLLYIYFKIRINLPKIDKIRDI
ncbi:putative membrane protein [Fermentimonas caenicola]|jgi:hypothetical protein|uniref:Putative membrane protein n=1 Tax=Fermentimonas caenicola TaxID=1562970 RepID=A0A098C178_9BACT|nr:putative membrane protein [Fermentimonas caenicola]